MSKFCGKCGYTLNDNGLCPKCDAAQIAAENEKQAKAAEEQRKTALNNDTENNNGNQQSEAASNSEFTGNYDQDNTYPKKLTKKEKKVKEKADKAATKVKNKADSKIADIKAQAREKANGKSDKAAAKITKKADRKADKIALKSDEKAAKKAHKAAEKASRSAGRKIGAFLLKLLAIILAIAILFSAVSGVLVYFNISDVPVISDVMDFFGIKKEDDDEQFKSLEGRFTDVSITDEASAVEAAKYAAKQMELNNAADELTLLNASSVDGSTYYRLQENYKGIPVYGRTMVVIADENGNAQGITSNATDIPENISLTPSVTQEQANNSIKEYISKEIDGDDATGITVEDLEEDKLAIYNLDDVNSAILAYILIADTEACSYISLVNAENGEIITVRNNNMTDNVKCYNEDGTISFNAYFSEEDNCHALIDASENIFTYSMEKTDSNSKSNTKTLITSADKYFNNTDEERNLEQDKAVLLYTNIQSIRKFFKTKFGDNADDTLLCFYNDKSYNGDNGYATDLTNSKGEKAGALYFGYKKNLSAVDLIAHEYMHRVEQNKSSMIYENESGAIMEGYSDIFGEIIEDYSDDNKFNGSCNWSNDYRNFKDPGSKKNPSKYNGKYFKNTTNIVINEESLNDNGNVHNNSTVISHCAYQMFTGLDGNNEKIGTETLAKLWYRTMLTLPPNCNFSNLYYNMLLTARTMGLSEGQISCINAAFLVAGITLEESSEECGTEPELTVLDKGENAYDNYTIKISGEKKKGWFFTEDYSEEIKVDNSNPKKLDLPEGTYSITVSDNYASGSTYEKNVTVKKKSENKKLKFSTDFGADYTVRSGVNINVYDVNKAKYDDYKIKVDGTADDKSSYSDTQTITNDYGYQLNAQNGQYTVTLTDSKDSAKTKSFTVRVKNSASASDINIETDFGKKYGQFDKSKVPSNAVEHDGHYYYIYEAKRGETDWFEAKENCESKDGYLATITSEDENKFVFTLLNKFGYKNAYFGLYDDGSNDWKWDNGETFAYSNWASGEPSSSFEDYGMYFYKYTEQWNDGNFSLPEEDGKTGYICEWGEYTVESSEIPVTTPTRTTSSERDIVLVLDTSGSMDGTPLDETKKASVNFVDTILDENASIGVVNYSSEANKVSDFSNSKNSLESVINDLGTGGGTNIESGLRMADEMLGQSSAEKKIIVLMSDGEPNEGLVGDELIAYADELKNKGIYVYTLGFFESLGDKTAAQSLMEKIASDGCHYEVSDADSLVFFFGDIADQINGQKYIYVRIACPVDVSVTYNGETLDSSDKALNTRTSFGTLTFEESSTLPDDDYESSQSGLEGNPFGIQQDYEDDESEDDRVKILRLKEGEDYDVEIEGTGRGRMDYSIGFMDENGEYTDFRKFDNIKITKETKVDTVASVSDKTVLNVDEDGDGKYDLVYKAEANGNGELVDYSYILYIVIGAVSAIALLVFVLVIRSKLKKRKLSKAK